MSTGKRFDSVLPLAYACSVDPVTAPLAPQLVVLIDGCGQGAPRSVFPSPEEQRSQLKARGRVLQGFYATLKSLLGLNLVERSS